MAGTIVTDRIESDASYASSINIASPMVVSNTLTMGSAAAITGNVNIDSGTLFVDAVNNRVGVGTATPANSTLQVVGGFSNQLEVKGTEADIWMVSNGPNAIWRLLGSTGGGTHQFRIYDHTNSRDSLIIDSSGRIRMPQQPYAAASISSVLGGAAPYTAQFESSYSISRGGISIDNSNGRFTVPVAGAYLIGQHNLGNTGTGTCVVTIRKNGSSVTGGSTQDVNSANDNFSSQYIVELAANDYIDFSVGNGKIHNNINYSRFYICLLG